MFEPLTRSRCGRGRPRATSLPTAVSGGSSGCASSSRLEAAAAPSTRSGNGSPRDARLRRSPSAASASSSPTRGQPVRAPRGRQRARQRSTAQASCVAQQSSADDRARKSDCGREVSSSTSRARRRISSDGRQPARRRAGRCSASSSGASNGSRLDARDERRQDSAGRCARWLDLVHHVMTRVAEAASRVSACTASAAQRATAGGCAGRRSTGRGRATVDGRRAAAAPRAASRRRQLRRRAGPRRRAPRWHRRAACRARAPRGPRGGRGAAPARRRPPAARGLVGGSAGASSQRASVASPASVRGVDSSSKSPPCAEEVEIVGVEMARDAERSPRGAASLPAVVEPGEAAFVERHRPRRAIARVEHARVDEQQRNERQRPGPPATAALAPGRGAATSAGGGEPDAEPASTRSCDGAARSRRAVVRAPALAPAVAR